MYAYKEIITLDNLQQLTLSKPLQLPLGRKIEVLIIAEDESSELDAVRSHIQNQGVTKQVINEALEWARSSCE